MAVATQGNEPRPYRFGYGVFDENLNMQKDPGEKKVYFEFSDYSTPYVFFEHPHLSTNSSVPFPTEDKERGRTWLSAALVVKGGTRVAASDSPPGRRSTNRA